MQSMQKPEAFGPMLRRLRTSAGLTLQALANKLSVSVPYLSDVELENRRPFDVDRVRLIAATLGAEPEELEKAAAVSRGGFTLPAGPTPLHVDVAAELVEMWQHLSDSDLSSIGIHCAAARARRKKAAGR
jgi:transcriptional regulator with XRE-family HTH domain